MPPFATLPGIADVTWVRGRRASPAARPDVVLEVAHGATEGADFDRLAREMKSPIPPDLRDFFFVNTDVGAPELALAAARALVERRPERTALVVRCRLPRTLVDCNRLVDAATVPAASAAHELTPGLPPWVRDPADVALLKARYGASRRLVEQAVDEACTGGGAALFVHTYAPRSIDVPVDERVVERLREAYRPEHLARWPLRAEVDLIADDPDGRAIASEALAVRARAAFEAAGLAVARSTAYALHPSTLAHALAVRHAGRTLCFEVRRDLLVAAFVPFQEMRADAGKVARVASALAQALAE